MSKGSRGEIGAAVKTMRIHYLRDWEQIATIKSEGEDAAAMRLARSAMRSDQETIAKRRNEIAKKAAAIQWTKSWD